MMPLPEGVAVTVPVTYKYPDVKLVTQELRLITIAELRAAVSAVLPNFINFMRILILSRSSTF
jgi:hypothetical protein